MKNLANWLLSLMRSAMKWAKNLVKKKEAKQYMLNIKLIFAHTTIIQALESISCTLAIKKNRLVPKILTHSDSISMLLSLSLSFDERSLRWFKNHCSTFSVSYSCSSRAAIDSFLIAACSWKKASLFSSGFCGSSPPSGINFEMSSGISPSCIWIGSGLSAERLEATAYW